MKKIKTPINLEEELHNLLLEVLGHREYRIMILRFGLLDGRPVSLAKIGDEFGVDRERIRKVEKKCLVKLKEKASTLKLSEYLEEL